MPNSEDLMALILQVKESLEREMGDGFARLHAKLDAIAATQQRHSSLSAADAGAEEKAMTLKTAMEIIEGHHNPESGGYRVHFETPAPTGSLYDYFPERGEPPIATEEEAWALAEKFAAARDWDTNIYVTYATDFSPVPGYQERMLRRVRQR